MGYRKAEEFLPAEVIELIQQYVDGQSIYIPRKSENRMAWGSGTEIRQDLQFRNQRIYSEYLSGVGIKELASRYYLSTKSIQRIIREMRMSR